MTVFLCSSRNMDLNAQRVDEHILLNGMQESPQNNSNCRGGENMVKICSDSQPQVQGLLQFETNKKTRTQ